MTCIVGIAADDGVWLGADSAVTYAETVFARDSPKVVRRGRLLLGYCGSTRAGQVLTHAWRPPKHQRSRKALDYLVCEVAPSLRELLQKHDLRMESGGAAVWNGSLLVGYLDTLYLVCSEWGVSPIASGEYAIGSGGHVALGALYASRGKRPERRVRLALEAACAYVPGCAPPFAVECV